MKHLYTNVTKHSLVYADSRAYHAASPMLFYRTQHTATRLGDGQALVAGGSYATAAEIYDPAADRWALADAMRVPRYRHGAVLLSDGRVLVVGGNLTSHRDLQPRHRPLGAGRAAAWRQGPGGSWAARPST